MSEKVTIYIAGGCGHCGKVKKLVKAGKVSEPVELIDVNTEKNLHLIEDLGLTVVPTAIKNGKVCDLEISPQDQLIVNCGKTG
jgi:glutaredoxin